MSSSLSLGSRVRARCGHQSLKRSRVGSHFRDVHEVLLVHEDGAGVVSKKMRFDPAT